MTNNTEAINYDNKRDIDSKHRKLLSHSEAVIAISKKANKIHKKVIGCNQLSSWNSLKYIIINSIQVITSTISSKIEAPNLKIRLKPSLLELKSSIIDRFSKPHVSAMHKLELELGVTTHNSKVKNCLRQERKLYRTT